MYRTVRLAQADQLDPRAALAVALFDKAPLPEAYAAIDQRCGGALSAALDRPEFSAGAGNVLTLYPHQGPERVFVLGMGKADRFDANAVRKAAARLVRIAFDSRIEQLALHVATGLGDRLDAQAIGRALGEGLMLGNFDFTRFKSDLDRLSEAPAEASEEEPSPPTDLDLSLDAEGAARPGVEHGLGVGVSVNLARELAATPPNVCNPDYLASFCRKMAKDVGLKCTIIDAKKAQQMGMGGLCAVGAGGSTPPALICLEHTPEGTSDEQAPILLVGKAITFDTGGYSVKVGGGMKGMKYDKCGGMAVIGALHAAATLGLVQRVVGLIPAAENMIDTQAYRVDDIITFYNGVTSEVTNTDAEGRLVLADALAYGTKTYKPAAVIDLATLTGGVVVALGKFCAGAFCNDEALRQRLFSAGQATGEKLWELPLWEEHRELMKGTHANLVNSGQREAHPIQGAAFLSFFIHPDGPSRLPTLPWCHLDIAGMAEVESDTALYAKGPTGFGVRLLAHAIEHWA